jgi:hypothetical protein
MFVKLKHLIGFVTILFMVAESKAQNHTQLGVKGGMVLSTLTGQGGSLKPGFMAGGYGKIGTKELLFFQAEVLLTQKGSRNNRLGEPRNFNLLYLDIPLMYGIEITNGLSVNMGIQPGILLSGSYVNEMNQRTGIAKRLYAMDYSTIIGAEYSLKENIFAGFRYNHGFVPIFNYRAGIETRERLPANRFLQFYAGYRLK